MTPIIVRLEFHVDRNHVDILPPTNAKTEAIPEILEAYIRSQIGLGEDKRPAIEKDVYQITLLLDLSDDSFRVEHDCGNEGLCLGILMTAMGTLACTS